MLIYVVLLWGIFFAKTHIFWPFFTGLKTDKNEEWTGYYGVHMIVVDFVTQNFNQNLIKEM